MSKTSLTCIVKTSKKGHAESVVLGLSSTFIIALIIIPFYGIKIKHITPMTNTNVMHYFYS